MKDFCSIYTIQNHIFYEVYVQKGIDFVYFTLNIIG